MPKYNAGSHEIILKRIRDIPSLPEVVNRILEVLGHPNTPASEIAKLISYDPGLTSKVLRMVNSAAYGFQRQISSIQHGIMILGFNNVRGLVLSASIFKLLEGHTHPGGLNHKKFWEHSLGTAVAARLLAKQLRIPDADDIFSAAMLHDIGKVVMDVYFSEDYRTVLTTARHRGLLPHGSEFYVLEQAIMGVTHTSIGSFLATKWKLPVNITEVIEYHHQPHRAQHCQNLVYLVALANEMAILEYNLHGQGGENFYTRTLLEYFDLGPEQLQEYQALLRQDMSSAKELLDSISSR
jgi:putative nucleotidyltransferase with HDIG domain